MIVSVIGTYNKSPSEALTLGILFVNSSKNINQHIK